MKSLLKRLILLACVLLLPVIAFAQDIALPLSIDVGGGYSIALPATWSVLKGQNGIFVARGDGLTVRILAPDQIDSLGLNLSDKTSAADTLIALYALPPTSGTITQSDIQKKVFGGRVAAVYSHASDSTTDEMDVAIATSGGTPGYLSFSADTGKLTLNLPTVSAIITSFDGGGASATEEPGSSGAATGGATQVDCTVSADSASSAQLRVGPGTNRGAISFLPAGVEVTVTGRIVLKDSSIWFQLDKKEAAPKGTSAAELWVAATDITTSGDCEHVGDKSAPPVIPGNVAPPPTTNNGSGDQGSANSAPGAVPRTGTWTATFNATTNASCQGYENVAISSAEMFDQLVFTNSLSVVNSNSLNYAGDVYTRAGGSNTFTGLFSFDNGISVQMWITVNSPTSMSGQATGNFTQDNVPCSFTVLFSMAHR